MHLLRDSREIIKAFSQFAEAKHHQSLYMKLTVLFSSVVIVLLMAYTYGLQRDAMSRILVVDNAGELRKVRSEDEDQFYLSLLYAHCEQTGVYANTFGMNSLDTYQRKASALCNKADLKRVWAMYENQGAYADAINRGVCYRYTFKDILTARNRGGNEYEVTFWGILEIIDGESTKTVRITSQGIAMRVKAHWPENVTGYFWRKYTEDCKVMEEDQLTE